MEVRTAVALRTRFPPFAGCLDVAWAFAVDIIRAVAVRVHLAKSLIRKSCLADTNKPSLRKLHAHRYFHFATKASGRV
jgi:hypothetical protein